MSVIQFLESLRGTLQTEADLIFRAMELAVGEAHGVTVDDLERIEAYWVYLEVDCSSIGFVASFTDGRRFHLTYSSGVESEDEPEYDMPEALQVKQMTTTAGLPPGSYPDWIEDVAELNEYLGLPIDPNARSAALATKH